MAGGCAAAAATGGCGRAVCALLPPRQENQQSFSVASRTYSLVRQAWPGPRMDMAPDAAPTGTVSVGDLVGKGQAVGWPVRSAEGTTQAFLPEPEFARYQNFSKGSRRESDAYIDPIVMEYYNWGCSWKPPEDEDDTNSYENVLLCGPRSRNTESGGEDSEDYQNSVSIHQWHKSMQAQEQVPRAAHLSPAGSPDEDEGEPDYVNGDVAAREA
ncbi:linker for activation of T-cells family member 2 isoform X3 [Cavia porcellus]|uniref:linker for activation of T-cells family member 2 isoform X3 n=1 Tax=Cavia porcellus TaxID=10141 RepID=UPI000661BBEA|nr:linker for activation of T-cells family member 2 isoform X5 [Cavia porcellus]XP_013008136.1 linker for activation of T-cells family member 2 isoform X5 [Cavia porcellus]